MNDLRNTFPEPKFAPRVKQMLKLDFYRLFRSPLFYIMLAISAIIPAMVLSMGGLENPNSDTVAFTVENTWELISTIGNSFAVNGFAGFATIDMVFIFAGILMAIFVARDYSSGFIKNIFTVHSKKEDYAISKTAIGVFSGICMIGTYFIGTVIAGLITSKGFDVNVGGLIFCLLSKMAMMVVFCSLYLAIAVFFKEKLWATIIATMLLGMMFYPVAIFANLPSTFLTLIMSLVGSVMLGVVFFYVTKIFLQRRDLA